MKKGGTLSGKFVFESASAADLQINLVNSDSNFSYKIEKNKKGNEKTYLLSFILSTDQTEGFIHKSLFLEIDGFKERLELYITAEIIP